MKPIEEINLIRYRLMSKEIDYKQAKIMADPFIDLINNKSKELSKKYNQKYKPISFSGLMR